MAVARREKNTDVKYTTALGDRPPLTEDGGRTGREFTIADVVEDLRDDVNDICDLSAINEAKVGITTAQASAITANSAKTTFPGFGTTSTKALRGNTTTITPAQAAEITANTAKIGQKVAFHQTTGSSTAVTNSSTGLFLGSTRGINLGSVSLTSNGAEFTNLDAGLYKITIGIKFTSTRAQTNTLKVILGSRVQYTEDFAVVTPSGEFTLFCLAEVRATNVSNSDTLKFESTGSLSSASMTFTAGSYVLLEKIT